MELQKEEARLLTINGGDQGGWVRARWAEETDGLVLKVFCLENLLGIQVQEVGKQLNDTGGDHVKSPSLLLLYQ